jgi:hypothetical protein
VRRLGQAPAAEGVPVLHLVQIQRDRNTAVFTREPSGFEAFFCGDLPSPQVAIAITGRLMIKEKGVPPRPITADELKKWPPKGVVNRVYTGRGVSSSTSPVSRIKPDGSFITESSVAVDPGTRSIRVQVTLDFKGGRRVTAEAIFQKSDLDNDCGNGLRFARFLALLDSYESRRPIGQVTGKCYIAGGHFEFLSSVRKMFQPAPGSPLAGVFDSFLYRNRKICKLAAVDSTEGRYIRSFEILTIDNNKVDIGHVLVGIEASRRQKPASVLPVATGDAMTEALVTWAGDLGSALEPYAEAIVRFPLRLVRSAQVVGRGPDIKTYLKQKASFDDLLGDIDGINIGSVYDDTKSLAENLRKYYGTRPFRRFHNYLARLTNDAGKPLLTLAQQKPPRIDRASRDRVSPYIHTFVTGVISKRKVLDNLTPAQGDRLLRMLRPGSKEMNIVIDYFFAFIERGLAQES